jgi:hypothetical protein
MLASKLKNIDIDRINLEEAVELYALGAIVQKTYEDMMLETPSYITDGMKVLQREIDARRRDNLEMELRKTNMEMEGLRTAAEKKQDLAARKARLEAALGKAEPKPAA